MKKQIHIIVQCPCERAKELPKTFVIDPSTPPAPAQLTCPYCQKRVTVTLPHQTVRDGEVLRGGFVKD